ARPAWALPLLAYLLLAGDGLLGTLAGAGVGMGALAVDRQAAAVADALVTADLDLALDVLGDVTPQVTLDLAVVIDVGAEAGDLFVGEIADARRGVDPGALADLPGRGAPDAEDVGERDLESLLAGDVDAADACHGYLCPLTLPLLVAGVGAQDHDPAV